MFSSSDTEFMRQALSLAARGLFTTDPNPRVGCVIVKGQSVVGKGWHERAGHAHAEVHALAEAGELAQQATVYVTLEPCSHVGRTPPCTDALIRAGVSRVVLALQDPNPLVNGKGVDRLRAAGIEVDVGLLAEEAIELNLGFLSRIKRKRPWVRMKLAASIDGKTALQNRQSQWITAEAARADGHRWRARASALLTGIGTVKDDDPLLNVRYVDTSRQPNKVLVDSRLDISPAARMLADPGVAIVTALDENMAKPSTWQQLIDAGLHRSIAAKCLALPCFHQARSQSQRRDRQACAQQGICPIGNPPTLCSAVGWYRHSAHSARGHHLLPCQFQSVAPTLLHASDDRQLAPLRRLSIDFVGSARRSCRRSKQQASCAPMGACA